MTVRESIIRLAAFIEFCDNTQVVQTKQTKELIIMLLKRKAGVIQ